MPLSKWIELVDADGHRFHSKPSVLLVHDDHTAALKASVKLFFADTFLHGVLASGLRVFRNRTAFDANETALAFDVSIKDMGNTMDDPIVVHVPRRPTMTADASTHTQNRAETRMTPASTWFHLVGDHVDVTSSLPQEMPIVVLFQQAVKRVYRASHLRGIAPSDLLVFRNRAAFEANETALAITDSMVGMGNTFKDPIVVFVPTTMPTDKWVWLVDADGHALDKWPAVIDVKMETMGTLLRQVTKLFGTSHLQGVVEIALRGFRNRTAFAAKVALAPYVSIKDVGNTMDDPIIVQRPRLLTAVFGTSSLPRMTPLANAAALKNDCIDLPAWSAGSTIAIPQIHAFMQPLGGCTSTGRLYWREEEKQVASILLTELLNTSSLPTQKSILMGSPGAGKSTMLCVLAFYVALVGKKNVLVVRRLSRKYCLFFLGHNQDGHVVWFSNQEREEQEVIDVFIALKRSTHFPTVRVLDGFVYRQLPSALTTFHFLATSDEVDLKSSESEYAYRCLLPSWRRDDLFRLGASLFDWQPKEQQSESITGEEANEIGMERRFYYSGGSVRAFLRASTERTQIAIASAVSHVDNVGLLLSRSTFVLSSAHQSNGLRRTFVKRKDLETPLAYRMPSYWEQAVDSEFALQLLRQRQRWMV